MEKIHPLVKYKLPITSVIIFLVSAAVRLINAHERLWWFGDSARDILVATHIAKLHEFPSVGPTGSFLPGQYYYPPYYYYLLSLIALFTDSARAFGIIALLWASTVPVLIFLIGLTTTSFFTSLSGALLIVFSSSMITKAALWSPFIAMPFFYLGMLLVVKYDRSQKITSLGVAMLLFSSVIHLSASVPAAGLLLYLMIFGKQRKSIGITAVLMIFALYIQNFILTGPKNFAYIFNPGNNFAINMGSVSRFIENVQQIWLDMFDYNRSNATISASVLLLGVLNFLLIKRFGRINTILFVPVLAILFIGSITIRKLDTYEFYIVFPLLFLISASIIVPTVKNLNRFQIVFSLTMFSVLAVLVVNGFISIRYPISAFATSREVVEKIIREHKITHPDKAFMIFGSSGGDDYFWNSPMYWYFLETTHRIPTVKIVDFGQNLYPINQVWSAAYVVCDLKMTTINGCKANARQYLENYHYSHTLPLTIEGVAVLVYTDGQ